MFERQQQFSISSVDEFFMQIDSKQIFMLKEGIHGSGDRRAVTEK